MGEHIRAQDGVARAIEFFESYLISWYQKDSNTPSNSKEEISSSKDKN